MPNLNRQSKFDAGFDWMVNDVQKVGQWARWLAAGGTKEAVRAKKEELNVVRQKLR